jgi:hypothetical protein
MGNSNFGVSVLQQIPTTNWGGSVVTTTANPQRLMGANKERTGWRIFNLNGATGRLGYGDSPGGAYIPLPPDATYPAANDIPCESNELWYHGPVGAVLGVGEA